ncbi:MAG: RNA-binding transcriptional accessory protein, partial [Flavobacterium sp.]|nr:RNA-binding transcriptional accessory protein [Flavobacterium sp.]
MTQIQFIKNTVQTTDKNIDATLKLFFEDCTIPFIVRYRKDQTGNLDEVIIEQIAKLSKEYNEIVKRKESILKTIDGQGQLSPELKSKIEQSFDLQEIEDLYLPFKKKKKTRADVARTNGLEPLAQLIFSQRNENIDFVSTQYINKNIKNEDEALQGARDIIAEWINENVFIRKNLRRLFQRKAVVSTKVVKKNKLSLNPVRVPNSDRVENNNKVENNEKNKDDESQKYAQYFDWSEPLSKAPSHRLLAMMRAENEGFIKLNIEIENDEAVDFIEKEIIKSNNDTTEHLELAIKDSYKRLLEPAISNETLQEFKAKA